MRLDTGINIWGHTVRQIIYSADHYLSGEMPRCLLSIPHRSFEYFLLSAPLILPILWREQRAQGSPFPPNIIIWSGLICTAMYCKRERHTKLAGSIRTFIIVIFMPCRKTDDEVTSSSTLLFFRDKS